jgi:UDP-2,4-diacetamido-2,4,6-trideoxy-beta-L-altropyranose hydrolase
MADAYPRAGVGHLSRSSALSVALERLGVSTRALALGADGPLERYGISWTPARPGDAAIDQIEEAVTIVDSYGISAKGFARLSDRSRVVALHDEGPRPRGPALLVAAGYAGPAEDGVLAGMHYVCLGPDYWSTPPPEQPTAVERVLVTTGARDILNLRQPLASAVRRAVPEAKIRLIGDPMAEALAPAMTLLEPTASLSSELTAAHVVVCAAGQTMLEAACVGTPTVALVVAANQRAQAQLLADAGGPIVLDPPDIEEVESAVGRLASSPQERIERSAASRAAVDGGGALRVAEHVRRLATEARNGGVSGAP